MREAGRLSLALALLALLLATGGCRTVAITSDPPGALVRINGEEVGATPLDATVWQGLYIFGGEYRFEAELPGHRPGLRRCREGAFGNVRSAVPVEIHFRLAPISGDHGSSPDFPANLNHGTNVPPASGLLPP